MGELAVADPVVPSSAALPAGVSPKEKRQFVRRLFSTIAPRYDWFNRLASCGFDRGWRIRTIAEAKLEPGMRVLDVCTGTGDLVFLAAPKVGSMDLVFLQDRLDGSESRSGWQGLPLRPAPALERPPSRRPRNAASDWGAAASPANPTSQVNVDGALAVGLDFTWPMLRRAISKTSRDERHVAWIQGDAQQLPFQNATFDRALIGFSTRNLSDLQQGLTDILRILKDDGQLLILETGRPAHPLLRVGYWIFLRTVARFIGWVLTGRAWPFTYLARSVQGFVTPEQMIALLTSCGATTRYVPLSGGLASLYVVRKCLA